MCTCHFDKDIKLPPEFSALEIGLDLIQLRQKPVRLSIVLLAFLHEAEKVFCQG
jgi:hypothetical protein